MVYGIRQNPAEGAGQAGGKGENASRYAADGNRSAQTLHVAGQNRGYHIITEPAEEIYD